MVSHSLTVAGVKIPKQQVALATKGYWTGDGISTGILGLGMSGLTEAFAGEPGNESLSNVVSYSPLVDTMSNSSADIPPVFSLGLSRKSADSFLALGGVPPEVKVGEWASTPLLQVGHSYSRLRGQIGFVAFCYHLRQIWICSC